MPKRNTNKKTKKKDYNDISIALSELSSTLKNVQQHPRVQRIHTTTKTFREGFFKGFASGIGTVVGATVGISILVFILSKLSLFPIIGEFASKSISILHAGR